MYVVKEANGASLSVGLAEADTDTSCCMRLGSTFGENRQPWTDSCSNQIFLLSLVTPSA